MLSRSCSVVNLFFCHQTWVINLHSLALKPERYHILELGPIKCLFQKKSRLHVLNVTSLTNWGYTSFFLISTYVVSFCLQRQWTAGEMSVHCTGAASTVSDQGVCRPCEQKGPLKAPWEHRWPTEVAKRDIFVPWGHEGHSAARQFIFHSHVHFYIYYLHYRLHQHETSDNKGW